MSCLSKNTPLVSVILPVYNGAETIAWVIDSVCQQTYSNWELIVVDDGSTDDTREIIAAIEDSRIHLISQANAGVAAARNYGVSQSGGEYLAFIDADDRWFPTKLETELNTIEQYGEPKAIVYSWYYAVDDLDRLINLSPRFTDSGDVFETILAKESMMLPSTTLLHREVFDTVGGFDASCYHEDRAFYIRACKHYPAFPTESRLVVYRQSLGGRCRRVLADYDAAREAEYSIVSALGGILSEEQQARLHRMQSRSLLYRFLMYGYIQSAVLQMADVAQEELLQEKKGILAWMTMKIGRYIGVNFLSVSRLFIQQLIKTFCMPWWQRKSAAVIQWS